MTERLNSEEIQSIIINLKGLRNEYYAHFDRNPKRPIDSYTPYIEEVEKLLEFSEQILKTISQKVFNAKSIFRDIDDSQADNFLKLIIEKRF